MTDFNYAGTFYNADSGLYLAVNRIYNPAIGRWLTRDPVGEAGDPLGNLYAYVGGNPISLTDPEGLLCLSAPIAGMLNGLNALKADATDWYSNASPLQRDIALAAAVGVGIAFAGVGAAAIGLTVEAIVDATAASAAAGGTGTVITSTDIADIATGAAAIVYGSGIIIETGSVTGR